MSNGFSAETVHEYEHETWDRCSDKYLEGFAGLSQETIPRLIEAAEITEGDKVLDVGSGPGHVADHLARHGAEVTGVDFVQSMIDVSKAKFPEIEFRRANAEQLPFEDNGFDAVVSNFVVHHLARPEKVFGEVARVLRPGGRFAFTVFADPEAQSSIGAFFQAFEQFSPLEELPHGPLFGVTDLSLYTSMLESAGLNNAEFAFHDITWRSETPDPIVDSFWDWGNMRAMPQDLQDKIETATRQNLAPYRQQSGDYAFPHKVLLGKATARD